MHNDACSLNTKAIQTIVWIFFNQLSVPTAITSMARHEEESYLLLIAGYKGAIAFDLAHHYYDDVSLTITYIAKTIFLYHLAQC